MRMTGGMVFGLAVAAMLAVGAPRAFAGQSGDAPAIKRSVTILEDATLGGRAVAQGKYEAEVSGGDVATLVLTRDRKEVARVSVRRAELAAPSKYDRVDVRPSAAGKEVVAIYFKGERASFDVVDEQGVAIAEKP